MFRKNLSLVIILFLTFVLFSFSILEGGSIKGRIIPTDGATQVWAVSAHDTLRAAITQGAFELVNAKAGTYKLMIDANEPYKDIVRDGIQVSDGSATDLGEIQLEK
jgi:hypothetical protein